MSQEQDNTKPINIRVSKDRATLTLVYSDDDSIDLSAEYLRISSPSAEVTGHGPGQEVTQHGKRDVKITGMEPVGRYAVRIIYSDGHETGLYRWDYMKQLHDEYQERWQAYIKDLDEKGFSRD